MTLSLKQLHFSAINQLETRKNQHLLDTDLYKCPKRALSLINEYFLKKPLC